MSIINNIQILRIVTIIVAAAFVPVFLYGVASIWMVVAGVISAQFFKARVAHILSQNIYDEDKKKNAWQLVRKYSLLVLEISIIMPLPIILFLHFSDVDGEFVNSSLDSVLLSQVSFDWVFPEGYVEKYYQIRAFIFFLGSAVVSTIVLGVIARTNLKELFGQVLYRRDFTREKDRLKINPIASELHNFLRGSYVFAFFIVVFYGLHIKQLGIENDKNLFPLLALSYCASYAIISFFFIGNKAFERLGQEEGEP